MNDAKLDQYLDSIISNKSIDPILKLRNIYTDTRFDIPANDILDVIERENLIIGANGAFTYNQNVEESFLTPILNDQIKTRKKIQKEAIKLQNQAANTDDPKAKEQILKQSFLKDNIQNLLKMRINSFYGIQVQKGSFLYLCDTASMITSQAREWTSETIWATERYFGQNFQFTNMNEMLSYVESAKACLKSKNYAQYIEHYPTHSEINDYVKNLLNNVPEKDVIIKSITKSLFRYFYSMNEETFMRVYYKNNFYEFISKNPQVKALVLDIIMIEEPLISSEIDSDEFPNFYRIKINHLLDILKEYTFFPLSPDERVNKTTRKSRKLILGSDTDSMFINLNYPISQTMSCLNIDQSQLTSDQNVKIVNLFIIIVTKLVEQSCQVYGEGCKALPKYISKLVFKNEFYFKRMLLMANKKKTYATHTRLREGKVVDKIDYTGLAFKDSNANPYVSQKLGQIIEHEILRSKKLNLVNIYNIMEETKKHITQSILSGSKEFGRRIRYKGIANYEQPERNAPARSCDAWNRIYPDIPINDGETAYMFHTTLITPDQFEFMKESYSREYNNIISNIFGKNGKESEIRYDNRGAPIEYRFYTKFGLSMISIPESDNIETIPKWLIPHIDIFNIVSMHLDPLVSLLPSLGLYQNRATSRRNTHTLLLNI